MWAHGPDRTPSRTPCTQPQSPRPRHHQLRNPRVLALPLEDAKEGLAAFPLEDAVGAHADVPGGDADYGIVGANTGIISTASAPFGGVKESGYGRESGSVGIEYQDTKYVLVAGVGS